MTNQPTKARLMWIILQVIFMIAIWLPNMAYIFEYAPKVFDETRLKAEIRLRPFAFPDFLKYYVCASLAKEGKKELVWSPDSQKEWIEGYLEAGLPEDKKHKVELQGIGEYTPQFVMLMIPWTYVPFNLALILWLIGNLLFLILTVTPVLKTNASLPSRQYIVWWLFLLASGPCWFNFFLGQSGALATGLTALFYVCWLKNKNLPAGIAMTLLAVVKPHFLVIPLIMAIVYKRWTALWIFLATSVALLLAATCFFGWQTIISYPMLLKEISHGYATGKYVGSVATCITFLGPLCAVMPRLEAQKVMLVVTAAGLMTVFGLWFWTACARDLKGAFALSLTMLILLISSAHGLFYDLLLLAVPWAATIQTVDFASLFRIADKRMMLWCYAFMLLPAVNWLLMFSKIADGGPVHVPIMILLMLPAFSLWREEIARARQSSATR